MKGSFFMNEMQNNFSLLTDRVLDALNKTNLEETRSILSKIKTPTIIKGNNITPTKSALNCAPCYSADVIPLQEHKQKSHRYGYKHTACAKTGKVGKYIFSGQHLKKSQGQGVLIIVIFHMKRNKTLAR